MNTTLGTIGHYVIVSLVIVSAVILAVNNLITGSLALTVIALAGGVSIGSGVTLAGSGSLLPPQATSGTAKPSGVTPPTSTAA